MSLFSAAILLPLIAQAGLNFQVIKSFGSFANDSSSPFAGVIEADDGSLYGTTDAGGVSSYGTVFKVNKDGSGYEVLYSFGNGNGDGKLPHARLLQGSDGSLYGTTSTGGTNSAGTVFKLSKDGSNYAVLYHFGNGVDDGVSPQGELIQGRDGALYGTTLSGGGTNQPEPGGTIFKLNTDGSAYQVLHRFATTLAGDAENPESGLLEGSDGALYGLTYGGGTNNNGAVFKLNQDGSGYRVLYSLGNGGNDGSRSFSNLIEGSDGALYGTCSAGGLQGNGTVFKIGKDGSGFLVLHHFTNTDGLYPYAGMLLGRDGVLHGTTLFFSTNLVSTVFRIKQDGSGYALSHVFLSSVYGSDGTSIYSQLIQASDGAIYGTAASGGAYGGGTAFQLIQTPPTLHAAAETNGSLKFTWDAEPGLTYQLQYVTRAAATNWSNLGSATTATATIATFTDFLATNSPRFYRLLALP